MPLHNVVRGSARARGLGSVGALLLGLAALAACTGGSTALPAPAPTANPSASPSASPTASATSNGGGEVVINIPTPAPVLCTPAPVSVPVGQRAVIECTSQGYNGPFTLSLSDPTVASVQVVGGTYTFFYVNGLVAGTTTLTFGFSAGGTGSVAITITP
jgi:hypothetical protein